MITAAIKPRPGAAKGVVPKKGIGIAFCRAGVPGSADIVKVTNGGDHQAPRDVRRSEHRLCHRCDNEESNEEANAAIGDDGTGEHDGQNGAPRTQLLGHKAGDRLDRAAVLHELSEQGPEQKQREELRKELGPANHENLGPVREERLSRGRCRHERRSGRK